MCLQVLDGGPDPGGDGLGLDEEEFRFGGWCLLGGLLIAGEEWGISLIGFSGLDGECSSGRSFDGSKGGYNSAIGIADLCDNVRPLADGSDGPHGLTTK